MVNNDQDNIFVPRVSYSDILKQKRVLEKIIVNPTISKNQLLSAEEITQLNETLNLLDYLQDNHRLSN